MEDGVLCVTVPVSGHITIQWSFVISSTYLHPVSAIYSNVIHLYYSDLSYL